MPRKPRFYQSGVPAHVFQRGHNKFPVFFEDFDYLEYLRCLKRSADKHGCYIHAYVLMTNHIHLLLTPQREDSISQMFQGIGRDYVRYINQKYQRCGGLWEGRHKGNIIESCRYLLSAMRYIEMNPVRAGMVVGMGSGLTYGYLLEIKSYLFYAYSCCGSGGVLKGGPGVLSVLGAGSSFPGHLLSWPEPYGR